MLDNLECNESNAVLAIDVGIIAILYIIIHAS